MTRDEIAVRLLAGLLANGNTVYGYTSAQWNIPLSFKLADEFLKQSSEFNPAQEWSPSDT